MAGMLSAIGIIAVGWMSDRFGRRQTATLSYVSTIIGIVALLLVSVSPSLLLVYAFVLFFGLMQGARGPIIVALVATLFPARRRRHLRDAVGCHGLGAALGSWISGVLYEHDRQLYRLVRAGDGGALMGLAMFWSVPSLRNEKVATLPGR